MNSTIDKGTWDDLTRHGCGMCEGNIYDEDNGKVMWTFDRQPICPSCCSENNWSIQY